MKKIVCFVLAVLTALSLCACGADKGEASVESVRMICGLGTVGRVDRFSGVVSPMKETSINAAEGSVVDTIKVAVGDEVKKGDILFTYNMDETSTSLERKNLEIERLKNEATSLKNQRTEMARLRDNASGSEQKAYALEVQELDAQILENTYNTSAAQKEAEKLSNLMKESSFASPVDGAVQSINKDGGTDSSGNALPLITLVETAGFRVKGYVNENNASSISEGMAVLLRSRVDDSVWHGTISTIDFNSPVSSTSDSYYGTSDSDTVTSNKYPFYVSLDLSDGLMLGQHVYIEPDYGQDEAGDDTIQLPEWYINDADSNPWVWAQGKTGKLEKRSVTLGEYDMDMGTYPILEGLTADDYIAFPDEGLVVGMTCVTYDESSFSDGEAADGDYSDEEYAEDEAYTEDETVTYEASDEAVIAGDEDGLELSTVEG